MCPQSPESAETVSVMFFAFLYADDMDAETPDDDAENAVEVIDAAVDEAIVAAVEASCETEGEGVEVEPEA